ncbi:MAG: GtrA family protein [Candidatus Kerfeldbacteria bacterium]|nr:GtrA family protein [Candidatus Kerfeldbacteria bacterium]
MINRLSDQIRDHPFVRRRPVVKQFIKFSLVGVINTATSTALYLFFTRLANLDPLVANALAFGAAVSVSFILNKRWTFRDQQRRYARQYAQFFLVSIIGLGLSEAIIFWLHKVRGAHDLLAFAVAVVTVVFWNFSANKWWTFRSPGLTLPS